MTHGQAVAALAQIERMVRVGEPKIQPTADAEWAEHFRLENKLLRDRNKELEDGIREHLGWQCGFEEEELAGALAGKEAHPSSINGAVGRAGEGEKTDG